MMQMASLKAWIPIVLAAAALVSACSSEQHRAPVEDRSASSVVRIPPPIMVPALPGSENAGKPGYYTVRPGDTVRKIAAQVNQPWREVARWNNLGNPNAIEVGQVLRVMPPPGSVPTPASAMAATASAPVPVATQTTPGVATAPAAPPPPPSAGADDVDFIWPASGQVVDGFDEAKNNTGLSIAGKAGDPVIAAADGIVLYAGTAVRGYGNVIVLQHNNTFLTAYAHNQTLLVKDNQRVKKGQKIAEMGSSESSRVVLGFEIRRSGKPVDPARYLPAR